MFRPHTLLPFAVAVLLTPCIALAWQNPYTHGYSNNIISDWLSTRIYLQTQSAIIRGNSKNGRKTTRSAPPRVTFKAARTDAAESFAGRLIEDREERAATARYLKAALDAYRRQAAQIGRENDLGCALAFFITISHAVAKEEPIPEGALEAVAGQMDGVLRESRRIASTTDRQRQELADFLVCAAVFVHAGYRQGGAKHDVEQVQRFRGLAATQLEQLLHLDPATVKLTAEGLSTE